jgi:hypothetical protein
MQGESDKTESDYKESCFSDTVHLECLTPSVYYQFQSSVAGEYLSKPTCYMRIAINLCLSRAYWTSPWATLPCPEVETLPHLPINTPA